METIEKNILIAKWLGWFSYTDKFTRELVFEIPENHYSQIYRTILTYYGESRQDKTNNVNKVVAENLQFDSDSNWQWLCLEKIAKDNSCNLVQSFEYLKCNINSKSDLFEAIVNYVKEFNWVKL